jgi:hypothetical protein
MEYMERAILNVTELSNEIRNKLNPDFKKGYM